MASRAYRQKENRQILVTAHMTEFDSTLVGRRSTVVCTPHRLMARVLCVHSMNVTSEQCSVFTGIYRYFYQF